MKKPIHLTLFLLLIVFSTPVLSQNSIGYVNSATVFNGLKETETVRISMRQFAETLEGEMVLLSQKYQDLIFRYQNLPEETPEAVKKALAQEISDQESRMNMFEREAESELQSKEAELMQPVIDRVEQVIRKIAIDKGYLHIFDTDKVLVFPEKDDLTSFVIAELNR